MPPWYPAATMSEQVEATAKLAPCPHCGELHGEDQLRCPKTDLPLPFEGRRLDGKFRFLSSLGSGGMASVWLARNERVDRDVAIKFLRPEVGRDPEAVARFRSEARAAGRIGNKHICEILDLGDSPIGPYMVLERLRGLDLAALIHRQGRLEPGYAVRIVRHALEGLAAAHAAGIVHRDIKPGNVFLHRTDDGDTQVKLMDFGVSKFLDGTGDALTASGILLGTPEYMAPEQLEGANKLGPAADIFAMGAILYRSITGQLVFSGPNLAAVIRAMAIETPTRVDQLVEGLPAELVAIIHRCLERDPAARFPSAGALSDALAPFEEFEGEVRMLEPPTRGAIIPLSKSEPEPELLPSAIVDLEPDPHPAESLEPATKLWKQDSSGPLRTRSPEMPSSSATASASASATEADSVAEAESTPAPTRAPPTSVPEQGAAQPRRAWPSLLVGAGVVALALVLVNQFGPWGRTPTDTSPIALAPESDTGAAETGQAESETGQAASESGSSETGLAASESGLAESETGEAESESGLAERETDETDDGGAGPAFVASDRPAPAGTFRVDGYITPNEPGPSDDHSAARKYCEGLAARRFAEVSKWRLANPAEAGHFIGSKLKSSRYWTSAVWQGQARVYSLPRGKKTSEKIDRKIARPLCVARW